MFRFRLFSRMAALSDLSFIDMKDYTDPASLFQDWVDEADSCGTSLHVMNLATATKTGKVSNGTVVIREILMDGAPTFTAQKRSNKIRNIVRLIGLAERLSHEQCKIYFDNQQLPAKLRAWIGQECRSVDWNDLKARHDDLLKETVEARKVLPMPDSLVAYKIVPNEVDFYYSVDDNIGDRILFKRAPDGWTFERMMP